MNKLNKCDNLDTLLKEYIEMKNEIRAAWSQYYSILYGVILTGIATAFYLSFNRPWLTPFIPYMIISWLAITTIMKCNVRHISNYISGIERDMNNFLDRNDLFTYESCYARTLWQSNIFKLLFVLVYLPISIVYFISVYKAAFYIKQIVNSNYFAILYFILTLLITTLAIYLLMKMPDKI